MQTMLVRSVRLGRSAATAAVATPIARARTVAASSYTPRINTFSCLGRTSHHVGAVQATSVGHAVCGGQHRSYASAAEATESSGGDAVNGGAPAVPEGVRPIRFIVPDKPVAASYVAIVLVCVDIPSCCRLSRMGWCYDTQLMSFATFTCHCTHSHTHLHTSTHIHAPTHAPTHPHTHILAHTHLHTRTDSPMSWHNCAANLRRGRQCAVLVILDGPLMIRRWRQCLQSAPTIRMYVVC